jgi:hypothetical protein
MAHSISVNDFVEIANRPANDFMGGCKPVSARDFMAAGLHRRTCLADDLNGSAPQSQVDRLISDLMDIIVRAANTESAEKQRNDSPDAVAEVVALSMMQALLRKDVRSGH